MYLKLYFKGIRMSETIKITFGSNDYPYQILEGALIGTNGNPGVA